VKCSAAWHGPTALEKQAVKEQRKTKNVDQDQSDQHDATSEQPVLRKIAFDAWTSGLRIHGIVAHLPAYLSQMRTGIDGPLFCNSTW